MSAGSRPRVQTPASAGEPYGIDDSRAAWQGVRGRRERFSAWRPLVDESPCRLTYLPNLGRDDADLLQKAEVVDVVPAFDDLAAGHLEDVARVTTQSPSATRCWILMSRAGTPARYRLMSCSESFSLSTAITMFGWCRR